MLPPLKKLSLKNTRGLFFGLHPLGSHYAKKGQFEKGDHWDYHCQLSFLSIVLLVSEHVGPVVNSVKTY